MEQTVSVRVEDLRRALNVVLDEVERSIGTVIDLGADYYWVPDVAAVYDLSESRAPTTVGQLSDDVETIMTLVTGPTDRHLSIWHDLSHINGVLARIAALDTPGA